MSSNSTYYQYREVKVKIAHRLQQLDGWTVYGYYADNSDPMTDYYDPAFWGGIATKNGYTLVVDHSSPAQEYRRTYTVKTNGKQSAEIAAKIAKLEKMTQDRGASAAEEATAKAAIEKLKEKATEGTEIREDYTPGHLANPPRCNWHIEKNGIIIDKGTGLLKFSGVADISGSGYTWEREQWQKFNNLTRDEWIKDYTSRPQWGRYPTEEQAIKAYEDAEKDYNLLDKFNELIARFNNIAGGMVSSDGDSGYTYEARKVTKYKTVYKFKPATSGSFSAGQCFRLKSSFTYGCSSGTVYRLENVGTGDLLAARRVSLKSNKSLTGDANRSNFFGYYTADGAEDKRGRDKDRFRAWIDKGAIEWGSVEEVREPYEVEKMIKVDANGNEYKPNKATEAPKASEAATATAYTVKADTDTRDGSPLFVVTLNNRVDAETFSSIRDEFKRIGGYYSKFKKGFIFKEDPTDKIENATREAAPEASEEVKQEEPATQEATAEAATMEEAPAAETRHEATPEELQRVFGDIWTEITNGRKLYTAANGNIYDDQNNLFYINIAPAKEPETIAASEAPTQDAQNDAQSAESIQTEKTPAEDEKQQDESKKAAPGYTGPASDFFTPDEIETLKNGEQVKKGDGWRRRAYFSTPYAAGVRFVYGIQTTDAGNITPRHDADFSGLIFNNSFYNDFKSITEEAADDINAAIIEAIPTQAAAEANAGTLEKYEQEQIESLRAADFTRGALTHFIEETTPSLYLYTYRDDLNGEEAIRYLLNPAEVVQEYATQYAKTHGAEILKKYISYDKTRAALDEMKRDKTNPAHMLKRINDATANGDEKTYRVTLTNGATVKVEAHAVRRLAYCGYMSEWYISASDRAKLPKDENGRPADVRPADIVTITHGARIIYKAA